MKVILCVIIIAISGTVGIMIGNTYNKKAAIFTELYMFFEFIKLKIAFFKNKLNICINEYISLKQPKTKFFAELEKLSISNELSDNTVLPIVPSNFTGEEKSMISQFLILLSSSDIELTNQTIDKASKYCSDKIQQYKNLSNTKGMLIKKLSICIGVLISIFIY